jgi:predicted ATPase with chaperone activity
MTNESLGAEHYSGSEAMMEHEEAEFILQKNIIKINGELKRHSSISITDSTYSLWAMSQLKLSARAYYSTQSVKLVRMIADLAGNETIQSAHMAEVSHYGPKKMMT